MQIEWLTDALGNVSHIVTTSKSLSALKYQGHEVGIDDLFEARNAHRVPRTKRLQSKCA